jgi:DNA/RNA-binding domain of Phe-tRNA-synthetase-like protein
LHSFVGYGILKRSYHASIKLALTGHIGRQEEFMFTVAEAWKMTYPGASVGILVMRNVINPQRHEMLDQRKVELEDQLRAQFSGYDRARIKALPAIQAYNAYYRRFKKTYHVQLQLESVVLKNRPIPRVAALVEAMFMAELKDLLLTAGHDLELVQTPVRIDVADGTEHYIRINGSEQRLKAGDMKIVDAVGVLSSIIYGPDRRTQIGPSTRRVLFTAYAPPGIAEDAVYEHLRGIRDNVVLVSPEAEVVSLHVYGTE